MKKLVFTQRVEIIENYCERRDCANQNIARFISSCGFLPVPFSNIPENVNEFVSTLKPDGLVLTGGNDLHSYGGDAPERDSTERLLIDWALSGNVPVIGFCRGMQVIADYFKAKLEKVDGHIACRHTLKGVIERDVNSYHKYGILKLPKNFQALAKSEDGVIEAIQHKDQAILGIMWHPERETPFSLTDIDLFKELFQ